MSDLIPYRPLPLTRPRTRRRVEVEVVRTEEEGALASAQLQVGHIVSSVAVHGVRTLADQAEAAYAAAPFGEEGYHAIVNAYSRCAVGVIEDLDRNRHRR